MDDTSSKQGRLRALGDHLAAEHGSAIEWTVDVVMPRGDVVLTVTFEGVRGMAQVHLVPVWPKTDAGLLYTTSPELHLQLMLFGEQSAFRDVVFGGSAHTCETSADLGHIARQIALWRRLAAPPMVAVQAVGDVELRALRSIARARGVAGRLDVRVVPEAAPVTEASRVRLARELAGVSADAIFANFPRDADGQLTLGETVLLARLESASALGAGREAWLVASGPQRRRDGDVIVLDVATAITNNEPHIWDEARWLWSGAGEASERERWGVEPSDADSARFLALLDDGRFAEAFAVYRVSLTDDVLRILAGEAINLPDASYASAWRDAARHALFRAAPWRFAATTARALAARKKAGRRPYTSVSLRLVGLPGQPRQRKASLVLTCGRKGDLSLAIERTASNARLPEVHWTRALDHDLRRLMLLDG